MNIETLIKNLTNVVLHNEQKTEAAIKTLESQITQLAGSINKLEANQGRLPSQAEKNPRENVSAITLHSGKTGLEQHRT
jgi:TolA-binding protein